MRRLFFRHAALNLLEIHKVCHRRFALPDEKTSRRMERGGCFSAMLR